MAGPRPATWESWTPEAWAQDRSWGKPSPRQIEPTTPLSSITAGGAPLDTSGLQITSEGKTYTINISGGETVQDLLNSINDSGAGLDAQINAAKTGINVSSRVSGADFSIGENGGLTATQLGIRTFTTATPLSQLNHGAGVGVNTASARRDRFHDQRNGR